MMCVSGTNEIMTAETATPRAPRIRPATKDDVQEIVDLVTELAIYEKEPDAVKLTPEVLKQQLFGDNPAIFAFVAEADGAADEMAHRIDGFALWFLNYSTWEGTHGIYLEDLYVREAARGTGKGKALLQKLASIAVERSYSRVEWCVLKWNQPSIDFYRSLGAFPMDEWDTYRLTGDALAEFGGRR